MNMNTNVVVNCGAHRSKQARATADDDRTMKNIQMQ